MPSLVRIQPGAQNLENTLFLLYYVRQTFSFLLVFYDPKRKGTQMLNAENLYELCSLLQLSLSSKSQSKTQSY